MRLNTNKIQAVLPDIYVHFSKMKAASKSHNIVQFKSSACIQKNNTILKSIKSKKGWFKILKLHDSVRFIYHINIIIILLCRIIIVNRN